jgi:hypothetical protein
MREGTIFGNATECFHIFLAEVGVGVVILYTFPAKRSVVTLRKSGQAF